MKAFRSILGLLMLLATAGGLVAQASGPQEISDDDGSPVILRHLPDWENARSSAKFIGSTADLKAAVGDRPILSVIEFTGGTDAASAKYPAGQLLIVEYANPQAATEADKKITESIAASAALIVYRRIGNYAAFVFDATDQTSANALLDQVRYEKRVQWLDKDPYYLKKLESVFVLTTTNMLVGSVIVVVGGVLGSTVLGLIVGFIYFRIRQRRRTVWKTYSDSGGLTRLNLDELSEPLLQK